MNDALFWLHIGAGTTAIACGTVAVTVRKGGRWHARAGTVFFGAMLVLGVCVATLAMLRTPAGSPMGGVLICYFVATSWVTARRRDGTTGWFEIIACVTALTIAAAMVWAGATGIATTPVGAGPLYAMGGFCLLAGLGDLNVVLRARMTPRQRISRHLWRMCFAFFNATGPFFIGQQGVMPAVLRGSPILFALGLAPLGLMVFWLVRVRFPKALARLAPA